MNNSSNNLTVAGLEVAVVRKRIKNMYIRVDPADGSVRVSAPLRVPRETIAREIERRAGWIYRRREGVSGARSARRAFVSGETHWFNGESYRLNVVEHGGRADVSIREPDVLELRVRPGATTARRRAVLEDWYRRHLREVVPELVRRWEPTMGVNVAEWRIKRMKTRWGTCNPGARRIWLNLELARRPPECLEYVVVHEMVHLLERGHNPRFYAYMDRFLPQWRDYRVLLSST